MNADDSISGITVDTPIAMITVFDWLLGIFMGLTDECFVVKFNRNHLSGIVVMVYKSK